MLRASWVIEPAAPVLLVWVCSGTFLFSPVFLMFVALPPAWLSQRVSEGVSWGRDSLQGLPSSAVTGGLVGFPLPAGCELRVALGCLLWEGLRVCVEQGFGSSCSMCCS